MDFQGNKKRSLLHRSDFFRQSLRLDNDQDSICTEILSFWIYFIDNPHTKQNKTVRHIKTSGSKTNRTKLEDKEYSLVKEVTKTATQLIKNPSFALKSRSLVNIFIIWSYVFLRHQISKLRGARIDSLLSLSLIKSQKPVICIHV